MGLNVVDAPAARYFSAASRVEMVLPQGEGVIAKFRDKVPIQSATRNPYVEDLSCNLCGIPQPIS